MEEDRLDREAKQRKTQFLMEFWAYTIVMHKTVKTASDNLNLRNFIK